MKLCPVIVGIILGKKAFRKNRAYILSVLFVMRFVSIKIYLSFREK